MSLAVSPSFAQDGILWAGTDSAGLWVSADRGKTWRRSGEESLQASVNALIISQRSSAEQQLLALATEGLLLSRDGGGTWTSLAAELLADLEPAAVVAPEGVEGALLVGLADGRMHPLGGLSVDSKRPQARTVLFARKRQPHYNLCQPARDAAALSCIPTTLALTDAGVRRATQRRKGKLP